MCCYVEYRATEVVAKRVSEVYSVIRADLASEKCTRDVEWFHLFSDEELKYFWFPNAKEWVQLKKVWGDLPVILSEENPNPRGEWEWDIYSMFDALVDGEYVLGNISKESKDELIYRMNFFPEAYPYGGTLAIEALVESLGGVIQAKDDGAGRCCM